MKTVHHVMDQNDEDIRVEEIQYHVLTNSQYQKIYQLLIVNKNNNQQKQLHYVKSN